MFQVGDRVKTTDEVSRYWRRVNPGMLGKVVEVCEETKAYPYCVQLDDFPDGPHLFLVEEIEVLDGD